MRKAVTDPDPLGGGFFVVGIAVRLLTAIASCIDHRPPHRLRNPFISRYGLHLVLPQRFFVHASMRTAIATSTPRGPASFPRSTRPVRADGLASCDSRGAARPTSQGPKVDIGARMRETWR